MEGHKSTIKGTILQTYIISSENSLDKMLMLKFSEC